MGFENDKHLTANQRNIVLSFSLSTILYIDTIYSLIISIVKLHTLANDMYLKNDLFTFNNHERKIESEEIENINFIFK